LVFNVNQNQGTLPLINKPGAVMVATEHDYAAHLQVNYGLKFLQRESSLILIHIEDEDTFEYYMKAVEKIPDIDTEVARNKIHEQLLAGPEQYAQSVIEALQKYRPEVSVETKIHFGHLVSAYREFMVAHPTDLLITHSKDDTQLAMHSIGYSLAVEFRETPILLL
ncbi:MAG: hypothetical protein AAFR61_22565, partial [Bacteroidota bacterium]